MAVSLAIYLAMLALFNVPVCRRMLADHAASLLSSQVGSEVSIGDLHISFLNRLVLDSVRIADRQGNPMLKAGRVAVKIDWLPLLEDKVRLGSVSLLDATIRASKSRPDSAANYQFLIDAFSTSDADSPTPLDLRVGSIILRRCNLFYDEHYVPRPSKGLSLSHLGVSGLDANVSLRHLTPDSLSARVRSLSFREQCGLNVRSLKFNIAAGKHQARLERFDLQLPHSRLALPATTFHYAGSSGADLFRRLRFDTSVDKLTLSTDDLVPLIPALEGVGTTLHAAGSVSYRPERIRLDHLSLYDDERHLNLDADVQLASREGRVADLQTTLRDFFVDDAYYRSLIPRLTRKSLPLPLAHLGDVRIRGTLQIQQPLLGLSRMQGRFKGTVLSDAGKMDAELTARSATVQGTLAAEHLQLARLLDESNLPSDITCSIKGIASDLGTPSPTFTGESHIVSVEYLGRTFRDLHLKGSYRGNNLLADILVRDPALDIEASLSAQTNGGTLHNVVLDGTARNFRPSTLGLSGDFAAHAYSGEIHLAMDELPRSSVPDADIHLRNLSIEGKDMHISMDSLLLRASASPQGKSIRLQSDFASLHLDGPSDVKRLRRVAQGILSRALPDFFPFEAIDDEGQWDVSVTIRDAKVLNELLGMHLTLGAPLSIDGRLQGRGHPSDLVITSDDIAYDGFALKHASVRLHAEADSLSALVEGVRDGISLSLQSHTEAGNVLTDVSWDGFTAFPLYGSLRTQTSCRRGDNGAAYFVNVLPSEIAIGNTPWSVSAGTLAYESKALDINGVSLHHADQSLTLDGRFSSNPSDSLVATLHKIDVEYILNLVDFHSVDFAGQASGHLSLTQKFGYPLVDADLRIPKFLFNGGHMGELHLLGGFNAQSGRILLDGRMRDALLDGTTLAKGYVSLADDEIDLDIQSLRTNLECLGGYLDGIMDDFSGTATGRLRLFGPLSALDFEGDEHITGEATLPFTGVKYQIGDGHVSVKPGTFSFDSIQIRDGASGTGLLSGYLSHEHLKHFTYAFDATANSLLVYNKGRSADLPFYSTAYGSGNVLFFGRPGSFEAEINMRPERGTTFTYIVDTPEAIGDASMVTFRDPTQAFSMAVDSLTASLAPPSADATSDIRLNMLFDVNPEAALRVIMDDKSGDAITLHGNGLLRAAYYNKGEFRLYGNYHISEGNYKMNIQDIIRKDFRFKEGGSIVFGGDPFEGDLDMQGVYTVNSASLSDLGIGTAFSQNSVRVNCLLNFSGKVKDPKVSFDLDLPTVNAEEKQMLLSVISTEEEMTTQVLYLLGIGRFYTNAGMQSDAELTAGAQSSAAMKSFLSSTLSTQLNQIISDAVGSSNWTFGANVSTGSVGTNDMEIEGLLSGRLFNNRLLVNGNIGYRDNTYYNTNFIGDFDVRYLLTPGGTVSLKAYSETNDRYFSKSALTTQGAGIQLRRDFTNMRDLFRPNKKKKQLKKIGK